MHVGKGVHCVIITDNAQLPYLGIPVGSCVSCLLTLPGLGHVSLNTVTMIS